MRIPTPQITRRGRSALLDFGPLGHATIDAGGGIVSFGPAGDKDAIAAWLNGNAWLWKELRDEREQRIAENRLRLEALEAELEKLECASLPLSR